MTLAQKIENMSDEELQQIWDSFDTMMWNDQTMYDKDTTMDDYGMLIYSEMGCRGLPTV